MEQSNSFWYSLRGTQLCNVEKILTTVDRSFRSKSSQNTTIIYHTPPPSLNIFSKMSAFTEQVGLVPFYYETFSHAQTVVLLVHIKSKAFTCLKITTHHNERASLSSHYSQYSHHNRYPPLGCCQPKNVLTSPSPPPSTKNGPTNPKNN